MNVKDFSIVWNFIDSRKGNEGKLSNIMFEDIASLLKNKYHGANNIKGIYFQILYSILFSFRVFSNNKFISIKLEGIEDIDLEKCDSTLGYEKTFIQVKYRSNSLTWNEFTKIITSFLSIYKIDSSSKFKIVTNKPFAPLIEQFLKNNTYRKKKIKDIIKKTDEHDLNMQEFSDFIDSTEYDIIDQKMIEEEIIRYIISEYSLLVPSSRIIMKPNLSDTFFT